VKTKDVVYLLIAVTIFLGAGYVGYTQLVPAKSKGSKSVTVEVVGKVPGSLDKSGIDRLNDSSKVLDYDSPVDLSNLGNTQPFGK
jgi:hypothetical protein